MLIRTALEDPALLVLRSGVRQGARQLLQIGPQIPLPGPYRVLEYSVSTIMVQPEGG
jgi:hypothetical protein